jgi:hypothetical protein
VAKICLQERATLKAHTHTHMHTDTHKHAHCHVCMHRCAPDGELVAVLASEGDTCILGVACFRIRAAEHREVRARHAEKACHHMQKITHAAVFVFKPSHQRHIASRDPHVTPTKSAHQVTHRYSKIKSFTNNQDHSKARAFPGPCICRRNS